MQARRSTTLGRTIGMVGLVGLALTGCGGGGGGSTLPDLVDVTVANEDTLVRAALVMVQRDLMVGPTSTTPVVGRLVPARAEPAGRVRATVLLAPEIDACTFSGTTSTVRDDRDTSGSLTVGDVETTTYLDCVEVAGETQAGTMVTTYTQIGSGTGLGAIAGVSTTADLSTRTASATVGVRGGFSFEWQFDSFTADRLRIAVPDALVFAIATPRYRDTVTLRAGYRLEVAHDATAVPPGGSTAGRDTTTADGPVESAAAGGAVQVATTAPFVQYRIDPYPRSGQFEVRGRTGLLRLTVVSTAQLRVEFDADGDGAFEATRLLAWSELY